MPKCTSEREGERASERRQSSGAITTPTPVAVDDSREKLGKSERERERELLGRERERSRGTVGQDQAKCNAERFSQDMGALRVPLAMTWAVVMTQEQKSAESTQRR